MRLNAIEISYDLLDTWVSLAEANPLLTVSDTIELSSLSSFVCSERNVSDTQRLALKLKVQAVIDKTIKYTYADSKPSDVYITRLIDAYCAICYGGSAAKSNALENLDRSAVSLSSEEFLEVYELLATPAKAYPFKFKRFVSPESLMLDAGRLHTPLRISTAMYRDLLSAYQSELNAAKQAKIISTEQYTELFDLVFHYDMVQTIRPESVTAIRLPLTFELVKAYCSVFSYCRKASAIDIAELLAMSQVGLDSKALSVSEHRTLDTMIKRIIYSRANSPDFEKHTSLYNELLDVLFENVYTAQIESLAEWRWLSRRIDDTNSPLYPEERASLSKLIALHGVEIENSVYKANDKHNLLRPNRKAKNFADYEVLSEEVAYLLYSGDVAIPAERDLVHTKICLAEAIGIISQKQAEILHKLINKEIFPPPRKNNKPLSRLNLRDI